MIEEIMSKAQGQGSSADRRRADSTASDFLEYKAEYQALVVEHQKLEQKFMEYQHGADSKLHELEKEREDLRIRITELEELLDKKESFEMERKNQGTQKLGEIQEELARAEMMRVDYESRIKEQTNIINDLNKKVDYYSKQVDSLGQEKSNEIKSLTSKLERAENAIEKYKQKLEEAGDLKSKLKSLQAERDKLAAEQRDLLARNKELEENTSKNTSNKSQLAVIQRQLEEYEKKNSEMRDLQIKLEYEAEKYKSENDALASDNLKYQETISSLEARIKELDVGESLGSAFVKGGMSNPELEETIENLKKEISRLESDNAILRSSTSTDQDKEAVVSSILEQAKRSKEALEASLKEESRKNLILQDQMRHLEKAIEEKSKENALAMEQLGVSERESKNNQIKLGEAEAALAETQKKLRAFEESLQEKQKEVISLKSEMALMGLDKKEMMEGYKVKLEQDLADRISTAEKALQEKTAAFEELQKVHEALQSELNQVKEDMKTLEDNNKDQLVQINVLQSKNMALLEKQVETTGVKGKEVTDESMPKRLELAAQKLQQAQTEKTQLQTALKKAKAYIEAQEKRNKELAIQTANFQSTGLEKQQYQTALEEQAKLLAAKETELENVKKELEDTKRQAREQREAFKYEQKLMVSAWYNLGLQLKNKGAAGKKNDKQSWLGKERQSRQLNRSAPKLS